MSTRALLAAGAVVALASSLALAARAQDAPGESLFGLSGDDYWTQPWKNGRDINMRFVADEKFGLWLDAPPAVDPAKKKSVPAPFLYVAKMRDAFRTDLASVAKVVVVRLDDRSVSLGAALERKPNRVDEQKLGANSDDPTSERHVIDLARSKVLEQPGTYVANVLVRGQISNRVRVVVAGTAPPAPEGFPEPASPELIKAPTAGAPAVPASEGLAIATPPPAEGKALLLGAFRLSVRPRERVPATGGPDYGTPRPTAIIPITLVAITEDDGAAAIRLRVPSFEAIAPGSEQVTGSFAIDLLALKQLGGAKRLFVYVFAGEAISGPHAASR
jgi:hypothetical protein